MRSCANNERYIRGEYLKREFVYRGIREKNKKQKQKHESKFTLLTLKR